jgi:CRISPR system Cascade subunit CasA
VNLLYDGLIRVQTDYGIQSMSLPQLLSSLGRDEVQGYVGIQHHQEEAFHVFLCYLAGAVMARSSQSEPVQSEDYWRSGMKLLADEAGEEAWRLVSKDPSRPAFMQPPLPPQDVKRLSVYAVTPDQLDLLPTAKNHDLKKARATQPHVDEWIFALISLQTMSGFFGRGNQGISRMNGGFGNRLILELVRSTSLGGRWRDAVIRLLQHRHEVLSTDFGFDDQGLVLVWLEQWDGKTSIPLSKLDPFYIEICRRIRLKGDEHAITNADVVPADAPRIDAKALKGVVGDAWAPISVGGGKSKEPDIKALTISPAGITAEVLRNLIFDSSIVRTTLHKPLDNWRGQHWLYAIVLVRGQGTTDGYYDRRVLIPEEVRMRLWGSTEQYHALAEVSKTAIEYAGTMQYRVLKPAVFAYLQGTPDAVSLDRKSIQAWWEHVARHYEDTWSDDFFPWLWSLPLQFDQQSALQEWAETLRDHASQALDQAVRTMPTHTSRRYFCYNKAQQVFWGALKNNFSILAKEVCERVSSG